MIKIQEISTKKELKRFVKFPFSLYKGNKYWVPPIISEEIESACRERDQARNELDFENSYRRQLFPVRQLPLSGPTLGEHRSLYEVLPGLAGRQRRNTDNGHGGHGRSSHTHLGVQAAIRRPQDSRHRYSTGGGA